MYPAGSTIKEQSVHNRHIYTNSSLFVEFWYFDPIAMAWSVFIIIKTQMLSFYYTCLICWGISLWEKLSIGQ